MSEKDAELWLESPSVRLFHNWRVCVFDSDDFVIAYACGRTKDQAEENAKAIVEAINNEKPSLL